MNVDIELYDFEFLTGCFWKLENGQWKGVLQKQLGESEIRVIHSNNIILLVAKGDIEDNKTGLNIPSKDTIG